MTTAQTAVGNQRVLGTYSASFLGSLPVKRSNGDRVVAEAASQLMRKQKKSKAPPLNVVLLLSQEALRCVRSLHSRTRMRNYSHTCARARTTT